MSKVKTPFVFTITKASGEQALFSPEKLRSSLKRSGASEETINKIITQVSEKLYDGISTRKIYQMAFSNLKKLSRKTAARYKLKRAIMELGPSGFPFEIYMSEILKHQGYSVRVGEIVKGKCVNHEIDIIAEKDNQYNMIECKYHNQPGYSCDVKIPLYIKARFDDTGNQWKQSPGNGNKIYMGWVVTNTKFTNDAVQYGLCAGLHLLGWDFPKKDSLREQIDRSGLYPITCLSTLTSYEKKSLLEKKIVLCRDIINNPEILALININRNRQEIIVSETRDLCNTMNNKAG